MIAYFPEPYADESWYSLCARFSDRTKFGSETGTMQALYGSRQVIATVDLPHRLGTLVSELPPGHACTAATIIDHYTLLPYFGPFLRTTTYNAVRRSMVDGNSSYIRVRVGACTSHVRPPKFFRTCPVCDRENREKYGETYWRRLFQLPGVELCPIHEVFLEPSDIRLDPLLNRHKYFSAQQAHLGSAGHRANGNDPAHRILLELTRRADWMLQQGSLNPGLEFLRRQYRIALSQKGFTTTAGSIRMDDLRRALIELYGAKLLELLQSGLPEDNGDGWLGQLLRKQDTAAAPLRHHLLMLALEIDDLERFFYPQRFDHIAQSAQPSGGPWPCLNPVCEHFRKLVIHDYTLEFLRKCKKNVALFNCKYCGYAYATHDWSKRSQKADFVRAYGLVWLDRLKELWANSDVSVREIGKRLGVDSKTVKQHAFDAGLQFPRYGKRCATAANLYQRRPSAKRFSLPALRAAWTGLRRKSPAAGTNQLRASRPALFIWLYRHDRAWLAENQPLPKAPQLRHSAVDWVKRDQELVGQIATVAARIRNSLGRPQRITVSAIGRVLGKQSLFEASLSKLPLTRFVIRHVVESGEDFAVRRVHAAAVRLRQTEGPFPRLKLIREAGLHPYLERRPRVKQALDYEVRPPAKVLMLRDRESVPKETLQRSTHLPGRIGPLAIVQLAS